MRRRVFLFWAAVLGMKWSTWEELEANVNHQIIAEMNFPRPWAANSTGEYNNDHNTLTFLASIALIPP